MKKKVIIKKNASELRREKELYAKKSSKFNRVIKIISIKDISIERKGHYISIRRNN